MDVVFGFLAAQPVIVVFLLVGLGSAFGRIRIAGVSLGAVAVLFAAMGLVAWSVAVGQPIAIPAYIGDVGLVVFAFCTGILAGPGFFNAMKTAYPLMIVVSIVLALAAGTALVLGKWAGLSAVTIAGVFAGAATNTPALAATGGSAEATVGYASTYAFAIVAAMAAVALALRNREKDKDTPSPIVDKPVRVDTTSIPKAADIAKAHGDRVTFSRRSPAGDGPIEAIGPDTTLSAGDVVNVVGPSDVVDAIAAELGHTSAIDITRDRSRLDFRRIILSESRHAGRPIASLGLQARFGANIVRVRRGDVEFVGSPTFVLQLGDRLRVVGPIDTMPAVTSYLGDSERGLADINPAIFGLGITVGLLLGAIQIPLPGGTHFSIGFAAGALIIGLIMGRVGRIGPVVTALPHTASTVLAEFGLLVFLAFAGANAGSLIVPAFVSGEVFQLAGIGVAVTLVATFGTFLVVKYVFRTGGTRLSGVVGGAQTNPAILGFANSRTSYDVRVALGYSLVYPAAMVVKILLAQVLVVF
ncbi:aspartate:alanine exchanger family transporter [Microbacterium sp. SS28]|uniref:aspartate:alanine exchanger family transporter n=1 Tax=Microbacterium sp. SS28 TaxID=2919948 RepID=UPI001FA9CA0C|nr:TrkA C-terminal domain-containing protein [Microbacterium sp. SS28]